MHEYVLTSRDSDVLRELLALLRNIVPFNEALRVALCHSAENISLVHMVGTHLSFHGNGNEHDLTVNPTDQRTIISGVRESAGARRKAGANCHIYPSFSILRQLHDK